jgi:hypothetical protein
MLELWFRAFVDGGATGARENTEEVAEIAIV